MSSREPLNRLSNRVVLCRVGWVKSWSTRRGGVFPHRVVRSNKGGVPAVGAVDSQVGHQLVGYSFGTRRDGEAVEDAVGVL